MAITLFKKQAYPVKLPYKEFESWFFEHPNAHAQEIADIFGISVRTAYNKLASFNRRNHDINGFGMADAFRDSYKAGIQDERRLVDRLLKAETRASLTTGILIGLAAGMLLDEWIRGRVQMTIDDLFAKFNAMGINIADLKAQGVDINSIIEMMKAQAGNSNGQPQTPKDTGTQTT